MSEGVNGVDWLNAIHAYYGVPDAPLPFTVAAEVFLMDTISSSRIASRIVRRGIKVGDDLMSTTTEADVTDAKQELIELGFLAPMFTMDLDDEWTETVLEFRIP